jgi:hypothetical protein
MATWAALSRDPASTRGARPGVCPILILGRAPVGTEDLAEHECPVQSIVERLADYPSEMSSNGCFARTCPPHGHLEQIRRAVV